MKEFEDEKLNENEELEKFEINDEEIETVELSEEEESSVTGGTFGGNMGGVSISTYRVPKGLDSYDFKTSLYINHIRVLTRNANVSYGDYDFNVTIKPLKIMNSDSYAHGIEREVQLRIEYMVIPGRRTRPPRYKIEILKAYFTP